MNRLLALLGLLLVTSTGALAQDDASEVDRIVDEFKKATQKLKAITADLEGLKVCKELDFEEPSKAKLRMMRPKKLHLHYSEPFEEKRIVNGDKAWIYEPELNQVRILDLSRRGSEVRGMNPLEMAFSGNVDDLRRDYNIRIVAKEKNDKGTLVYTLELKPKGEEIETKYSSIKLKMADGVWIPFEIVTVNLTGDTVETYKLNNLEINPFTLGWGGYFDFKKPDGVEEVRGF